MAKQKLILVCDTKNELDDQFAISYAMGSKNLELVGIISTQNNRKCGDGSVEIFHEEAKHLTKLAGKKIPCVRGALYPIKKKSSTDAIGFIIDNCYRYKKDLAVACTGPLTDVALALSACPEIGRLSTFYWLGGFKDNLTANHFRHREINIFGDTEAANIFFQSGADIYYLPAWGVADSLVISMPHFARDLLSKKNKLSNYLGHLLNENWSRFLFSGFIPKVLKQHWILFDVGLVAMVEKYGIIQQEKATCQLIGKKFHVKNKGNITIFTEVNSHLILNRLRDILLK